MRVVCTGGLGFIGSHLVKKLMADDHEVLVIDKMTYAAAGYSRFDREKGELNFLLMNRDVVDVRADTDVASEVAKFDPDFFIHTAAESHVDRSIDGPEEFYRSNALGTLRMCELARELYEDGTKRLRRFLYVSTDEVYGAVPATNSLEARQFPWDYYHDIAQNGFAEHMRTNPGNPYSASKLSGELIALAYHNTYGLPVVVTRGANTYGTHQLSEKFLPLMILKAVRGEKLPIYGDGMQEREWLPVADHVRGLLDAVEHGEDGEIYNLGSKESYPNIVIATEIEERIGTNLNQIEHVEDRPGHDWKYAMDSRKAKRLLSWESHKKFLSEYSIDGLQEVIDWYTVGGGVVWANQLSEEHLERKGLGK